MYLPFLSSFLSLSQHSPSHVQKKENKFSEPRARFYLGEIVLALAYLHGFSIIFRSAIVKCHPSPYSGLGMRL